MAGITIEIQGLTELQRKLDQLSDRAAKKVVLQSLRVGANTVKKAISANAPVKTGTLKKGFRVGNSRYNRRPPVIGLYLTLKKGRGRADPKDPFYGRWVESGYLRGKKTGKKTFFRRTGNRAGRQYTRRVGTIQIPGKFFAKRGFESSQQAAVGAIVAAAETKINQQIRELGL